MVRESKTPFALLGLLTWSPLSGYAMRKLLDDSLGNFWAESYGQIYPALHRLERQSLIRKSDQPSCGQPQKNVFAITPEGVEALRQWLRRPAAPLTYRVETLVKVFFSPLIGAEACKRHIERFRDEQEALLTRYRGYEKTLRERFAKRPELPFWLLTVDCGIKVSRAYLDWCDESLLALDSLPARNPARDGMDPSAGVVPKAVAKRPPSRR